MCDILVLIVFNLKNKRNEHNVRNIAWIYRYIMIMLFNII